MMIQADHDVAVDGKQHGRYPSFGQTKSQNDDDDTNSDGNKDEESIQLSEKGSMDKFKSIEVVKQLHADGEIAQEDFKTKGQQSQINEVESENQHSMEENLLTYRQSPLIESIRHLTFAKQDSQTSITEIHKYPQFTGKEPHVQSSGSIILKEPSMVSIRNRS